MVVERVVGGAELELELEDEDEDEDETSAVLDEVDGLESAGDTELKLEDTDVLTEEVTDKELETETELEVETDEDAELDDATDEELEDVGCAGLSGTQLVGRPLGLLRVSALLLPKTPKSAEDAWVPENE